MTLILLQVYNCILISSHLLSTFFYGVMKCITLNSIVLKSTYKRYCISNGVSKLFFSSYNGGNLLANSTLGCYYLGGI